MGELGQSARKLSKRVRLADAFERMRAEVRKQDREERPPDRSGAAELKLLSAKQRCHKRPVLSPERRKASMKMAVSCHTRVALKGRNTPDAEEHYYDRSSGSSF